MPKSAPVSGYKKQKVKTYFRKDVFIMEKKYHAGEETVALRQNARKIHRVGTVSEAAALGIGPISGAAVSMVTGASSAAASCAKGAGWGGPVAPCHISPFALVKIMVTRWLFGD